MTNLYKRSPSLHMLHLRVLWIPLFRPFPHSFAFPQLLPIISPLPFSFSSLTIISSIHLCHYSTPFSLHLFSTSRFTPQNDAILNTLNRVLAAAALLPARCFRCNLPKIQRPQTAIGCKNQRSYASDDSPRKNWPNGSDRTERRNPGRHEELLHRYYLTEIDSPLRIN